MDLVQETPQYPSLQVSPLTNTRTIFILDLNFFCPDMSDIGEYFRRFPEFNFNPSLNDWRQLGPFNALAKQKCWGQIPGQIPGERDVQFFDLRVFWSAIVDDEFDKTSLEHYQELCQELKIQPIPDDVDECKEELGKIHVNIVDLVQYRRDKRAGRYNPGVRTFGTEEELREYSKREKKWSPVDNAKSEMLSLLLRDFSQR